MQTEKTIRIITGRLKGQEAQVIEESDTQVKAKLPGGTIVLPKRSPNLIKYFEALDSSFCARDPGIHAGEG